MRNATGAVAAGTTLALLAVTMPAFAQDDPIEGEIRFGLQYLLDQERSRGAKFEEYREVPDGFVAEQLLFFWSPAPSFFFDVDAVDVAQRDQRIDVNFGKTDLWRGTIRWRENQRLWTDESRTLFRQDGSTFTLEDSFQAAVQAGGANTDANADDIWDPGSKGRVVQLAVEEGAQDVFVGHERSTGGIGFEFTPNRYWTLGLAGVREWREGTTPQSLGMYFSLAPAEVAAPYELTTNTLAGIAEYSSEKANIGLQASTSAFESGFNQLTWDNQMFLNDTATANPLQANPGRGRMALWIDSDWTRVGVFGGVNLPGRTRVDASVSQIWTVQDDTELLPMTINSLLTPSPLPASQFDGEHQTTQGQLRISSRPIPEFRWAAWVRMFDMSNESPSLTFPDYVQTDYAIPICGNINVCDTNGNTILDDPTARRNLTYGYERNNAGALVGWSPVPWFDGSVSYERENFQREFSAVEDSDEDIYKLALDFDVSDRWGLRTTFRHQERRADEYHAHYYEESFPTGEPYVAAFNEGSRRFYWTDRDRDAASLLVDFTATQAWSFFGEATYQDDEYFDPETGKSIGDSFTVMEDRNFDTIPETYDILLAGRTDDKMTSWTVGTAWSPGPRLGLSADYTFERWEYGLESRYRNVVGGIGTDDPLDNWGSNVEDDYETINFGLWTILTQDESWRLAVDFARSGGTGNIETHFVPGGAASGNTTLTEFPELETTLTIAMAAVTHIINPHFDYSVRYWFESWDEENFASDFNEPYMGAPSQDPSMANALFLGLDFEDYTNHILSAALRYRY